MVSVATTVKPTDGPCLICSPLPELLSWSGNTGPVKSILGNRVSNALGVEQVNVMVEVVDVVAGLVVASVEWLAGLAAEESCLLGGLESLGTSEETTRGNAVLEESGVVRAKSEKGRDVGFALGLVEGLKVLLDSVGASRTGEVEGAAITVVDTEDVVRRCNLDQC